MADFLEPIKIDQNVEMGNSIIKVIGVGGGGGNAVNHMYNIGIRDVRFALINTDRQALESSPISTQVLIGETGLGAGAIPSVAQEAAEKDEEKIRRLLSDGTKMVFITATEGGGTGTGASPTVAKIARSLNILTVGIVTIPFAFEGKKKIRQAFEGVAELSNYVDALLIINNQKLMEIYPQLQMLDAFHKADEVLAEAAKSVAEIVTVHGYINIDFADVYSTLHDGNIAIMNTGRASGENRITNAIENALCSPLINTSDVQGARKILLSLYCSSEHQIRMDEIQQVHDFMEQMGDDVDVIWGAFIDESMGEDVKVTLIATGYEMSDIPGVPETENKPRPRVVPTPAAPRQAAPAQPVQAPAPKEEKKDKMDQMMDKFYKQDEPQPVATPVAEAPVVEVARHQPEPVHQPRMVQVERTPLTEANDDGFWKEDAFEAVPAWKRRQRD